ncbi:MraY family glycosyltransferase [Thalassomonas sp. M1454]|uniref:MraY family glycosyltransferase n=1 Tax=Thalassomonas sp. M1454 TaxID=2594477 RepID=UPI00117E346C|nr:glycosyltransferase family 4 protein [Thalassomonas sp. M1454]TRX57189.1 glycosyltransferase family 4 protein [Thalassomonas sp. M1454]
MKIVELFSLELSDVHIEILSYVCVFLASLILTKLLRRYALLKNVIDIPNDRSSHSTPTPRGGGISIVVSFLIILLVYIIFNRVDFMVGSSIFVSGLLVAIIGFADDHSHIDAKWRLLIHALASFGVVFAIGGLPTIDLWNFEIELHYFGYFLSVVAIIWILNLFNFMDGIDGIASVEAITATLFAGLFLSISSPDSSLVPLLWLLSASVCGFLVLNFPPAKIFMGDAGSGFLGFILASLMLASAHVEKSMLWVWLTLLGVFIVDATFTLIHRLICGEKIHEAHRSHAYQFASRKYKSHLKVTLSVLVINTLWLAPIAYLIISESLNGVLGVCIAYFPLVWLALKFNAGAKEIK